MSYPDLQGNSRSSGQAVCKNEKRLRTSKSNNVRMIDDATAQSLKREEQFELEKAKALDLRKFVSRDCPD
jgi:hypothetical protein